MNLHKSAVQGCLLHVCCCWAAPVSWWCCVLLWSCTCWLLLGRCTCSTVPISCSCDVAVAPARLPLLATTVSLHLLGCHCWLLVICYIVFSIVVGYVIVLPFCWVFMAIMNVYDELL